MKILIMGGTQFVSKALTTFMIKKGHSVSIFTRNKLPVSYKGLTKHFVGDRKQLSDLKQLEEFEFEAVFDLSAYVLDDVSNLLTYLKQDTLKRYVFCSSGAVYKPTEETADENFPCGINKNWGDYGLNKLEIEKYLNKCYLNNGLPIVIVRPTYIYGPGNNLYREQYFFERTRQNKIIPLPAGDKKVQFIYIDDLLNIFEALIDQEKVTGQTFNVTHSEPVTWKELIEAVSTATNKQVEWKEIMCSDTLEAREFFPFRNCTYLLSIKKLKNYHLPEPKTSLKKGLNLSYDWFLKTPGNLSDSRMNKIEEVL